MSIYTNNPLLRGEGHIRLLRIVPGSSTDEIKCTFRTFNLDAAPRYKALSYEWGPKSPSKSIYVLGQQKTVRLNLWNFLARIRSYAYHDYLWCDAICIDQSNDYERNHQVQLMSQIYRKAQSVLVWLGQEYQNSSSALHNIHSISTCMDSTSRTAYLADRAIVWKALVDLSKRRYWTRIWIVQEITVARDVELFCGDKKVPWPVFATACKFPPDQLTRWASDLWTPLAEGDEKQLMRRAAGRELYHSTMYRIIRSQRRWPIYVDSFEALYERYKESGCEDNRDRVFALLAIAKEVVLERGFTVDYQKNMEETFISLVAWGGTGPIAIHSRIQFALLAAKAMNLKWRSYSLESDIKSEFQRSRRFSKWVRQSLSMAVRCRYLGNWRFSRHSKIGWTKISPKVFNLEPVEVYLPLSAVKYITDLNLDLFGFGTSNVLLACKATQSRSWTVVSRAFFRFHDESMQSLEDLLNRNSVRSVFEGLNLVADETNRYSIELKNVAQFMEILLDKLDPKVWRPPKNSGGSPKGAGSLAKPKNDQDRGLKGVLQGLKITSPVRLTEEEEGNPEEIDEDESLDADYDKLLSESEALVKPRIPRPPVEKPRRRRSPTSLYTSEVDRFMNPFCERKPAAESLEASSTSPTLFPPVASSVMSSPVDFTQPLCVPCGFAPVPLRNFE